MKASLNKITDLVMSGVTAGLQGVANHALSRKQVKEEIVHTRARMAREWYDKNIFQPSAWSNRIQAATATKCSADSLITGNEGEALRLTIPALLLLASANPVRHAVLFVGSSGKVFNLVEGNGHLTTKWSRTSGVPTVWINDTDLWVFNPPADLTKITLEAVFANPRDGYGDGNNPLPGFEFGDEECWPMPVEAVDLLTGKLIDSLRYYRTRNPQPNTQSEINRSKDKK